MGSKTASRRNSARECGANKHHHADHPRAASGGGRFRRGVYLLRGYGGMLRRGLPAQRHLPFRDGVMEPVVFLAYLGREKGFKGHSSFM